MIRRRPLAAAALVALIALADTATSINAVAASHGPIQAAVVDVDDETLLKTVEGPWSRNSAPTEWIKVAFADVLGREIARKKGQPIPRPAAPNTGDAAATSFDGWIPRITPASGPTDHYVANAVDWMMQEIVDELGIDAVRQLITRVVIDQRSSYGVPLTTSSLGSRQLLDLLEYDARSTKAQTLFEKYVFQPGPTTVEFTAARPSARARYEALVAAAGEWKIPFVIPLNMSVWTFSIANDLMKQAETVVRARDEIAKLAAQFGATPSPVLRQRFEEAQSNFDDAALMATAELASAREIAAADARLDRGRGLLERIGLWSESPELQLEQAKQQFSNDSFPMATANLLAFHDELDGARSRGRFRMFIVVVPLVLLWAATIWVRRLRQRARDAEERRERAALRLSTYGRSSGAGYTPGAGYSSGDEGASGRPN